MAALQFAGVAPDGGRLAARRFDAALVAGRRRCGWPALTRRGHALRRLEAGHPKGKGDHYAGRQPVALADIRGLEGRTNDFEDQSYPLTSQNRQRCQRVANALIEGMALPPVELIQVGGEFNVRDGHHRPSVTRALGQEVIDANVTV